MGVKIAFGSRSNSGGEQMNGGQQYQNNGPQNNGPNMGGQYPQNTGQPMQAHPQMTVPQMAMPHMGGQMGHPQMNGGQAMTYGMAASYPVQHGPYVPGHHVPAPVASQMGYLAPLSEMGPEGMYPDYLGEEMRRGRSRSTGRYVHRSAMDGGEQMRGAGGGSGGWGMGHAESDEDDDGEVAKLKKKMKKLTRKLQKLEEELEEKESEGRKKKKNPRHDDDDDEDEDEDDGQADPQKKLGCALGKLFSAFPGVAESVFGVVASPPETWTEYLKKADFAGIAKMEFGELMKAVQEKKPLPALKKEIMHTAAALLMVCGKS